MVGIVQSGIVTPGHLMLWATDGVAVDGGVFGASQRVLAALRSANFNDTGDQPLTLPTRITAFQLTGIVITNASDSLTTAAGGFYPTISKGGTALVAAGQVYSSLTTTAKLLAATLAGAVATTRYSSANLAIVGGALTLYLSLTTAQGIPCTADVFVMGVDLT